MLTPDQLEQLAWLLNNQSNSGTEEYKKRYEAFVSGIAESDRHLIDEYKIPPPMSQPQNNHVTLLDEIQKVEWLPTVGFVLTINGQRCTLLGNAIFSQQNISNWYILQFGRRPNFGMKYNEFIDKLLERKEEVPTENIEVVTAEDLIVSIARKIKTEKAIAYEDKEQLKTRNRSAFYLYDKNYYYLPSKTMETLLKALELNYNQARAYLKDIREKSKLIRIGDDRVRFWPFRRDKIDVIWERIQNEGQEKLDGQQKVEENEGGKSNGENP